jgi:hypothetical protein
MPEVHRLYFEPEYPEFSARTMWSLLNAFTSAFKRLDPIPQFKATAKLGEFKRDADLYPCMPSFFGVHSRRRINLAGVALHYKRTPSQPQTSVGLGTNFAFFNEK